LISCASDAATCTKEAIAIAVMAARLTWSVARSRSESSSAAEESCAQKR